MSRRPTPQIAQSENVAEWPQLLRQTISNGRSSVSEPVIMMDNLQLAAQASIFSIPPELRVMIFELAVQLDTPVIPRQVMKGSNKFTWKDRERAALYSHPGNSGHLWTPHRGERLAVVSLSFTCKQFYEELRDHAIFYKANDFLFSSEDLVPYLAAITPERRNQIRSIVIDGQLNTVPNILYSSQDAKVLDNTMILSKPKRTEVLHKHALSLLSHCKGLRSLTVLLKMGYCNLRDTKSDLKRLRQDIQELANIAAREMSFWSLPGFNIKYSCSGYCIDREWEGQVDIPISYHRGTIAPTSRQSLRSAINSAKLDLSGEDRACGYQPVLSRTHTREEVARQKRIDESMDYRLGAYKTKLLARYDSDGLLRWRVREIRTFRWRNDGNSSSNTENHTKMLQLRPDDAAATPKTSSSNEFECEVVWWTQGTEAPTAWESARSLMTPEGLELLRQFYDGRYEDVVCTGPAARRLSSCGGDSGGDDLAALIAALDATPMPDEVRALGPESLFRSHSVQARWRRLQRESVRMRRNLQARYEALLGCQAAQPGRKRTAGDVVGGAAKRRSV